MSSKVKEKKKSFQKICSEMKQKIEYKIKVTLKLKKVINKRI